MGRREGDRRGRHDEVMHLVVFQLGLARSAGVRRPVRMNLRPTFVLVHAPWGLERRFSRVRTGGANSELARRLEYSSTRRRAAALIAGSRSDRCAASDWIGELEPGRLSTGMWRDRRHWRSVDVKAARAEHGEVGNETPVKPAAPHPCPARKSTAVDATDKTTCAEDRSAQWPNSTIRPHRMAARLAANP